jgi:hypothetical protein
MLVSCFLSVKACTNDVSGVPVVHGKSPCFQSLGLRESTDVGYRAYFLACMNMRFLRERA